jgi:hypothetical protein
MKVFKIRTLYLTVSTFIIAAWLLFSGSTLLMGKRYAAAAAPPNVGCPPPCYNGRYAPHADDPVECLIVGDSHGTATFSSLMQSASESSTPDLIFLLGDFARHPTKECHNFFWHEIRRCGFRCPVFLVPGDSDIYYDGYKRGESMPPALYKRHYGNTNYAFYHGPYYFIILNNVSPEHDDSYLSFLEYALTEREPATRLTFVLCHVPPFFSLPEAPPAILESNRRFFSLLKQYGVDRAFSAHEHGYWRGKRDGTDFIKVAGGGGRLPRTGGFGMFHHLMRIRINNGTVSEELLVVPETYSPLKRLRYLSVVYIRPFWQRHIPLFIASFVVPLVFLIYLLKRIF